VQAVVVLDGEDADDVVRGELSGLGGAGVGRRGRRLR